MNLQEIEQKVRQNVFQTVSFKRCRVIVKKRKENDSQVSSFLNIAKIMAV